jgi:copper chaperone CopZ
MTTHTTELLVQGMTCQGCVRSAQRSLAAIAGVTRVDVDLASGRATITHDGQPTPGDFSRALTKLGFTAGP